MAIPPPVFASQLECEQHLAKLVLENIIIPKKTMMQFALAKIASFVSQFVVFFLGFVLATDFLRGEKKVNAMLHAKVGEGALLEFFLLGLAILAAVGLLSMAARAYEPITHFVDDFMLEFPRAIYAFNASGAAAFAAVARYLQLNPQDLDGNVPAELYLIAVGFVLVGLLYGGVLSYVLRRKIYII